MPRLRPKKPTKRNPNPNGANQWVPDPRQVLFLSLYLDPESETFSNAYQSALKAKYDEAYATSLSSRMPTWLAEKVSDSELLLKAEKNLREFLSMPVEVRKVKGTTEVVDTEPQLVKIKQDTSKFVAERIGKKKWSQKNETEHSGEVVMKWEE